jgi:hypothetical protein
MRDLEDDSLDAAPRPKQKPPPKPAAPKPAAPRPAAPKEHAPGPEPGDSIGDSVLSL